MDKKITRSDNLATWIGGEFSPEQIEKVSARMKKEGVKLKTGGSKQIIIGAIVDLNLLLELLEGIRFHYEFIAREIFDDWEPG